MAYMSEIAEWGREIELRFGYMREIDEEFYQESEINYLMERESGEVENVRDFAKKYGLKLKSDVWGEIHDVLAEIFNPNNYDVIGTTDFIFYDVVRELGYVSDRGYDKEDLRVAVKRVILEKLKK